MISRFIYSFSLFILLISTLSCKTEDTLDCFPSSQISATINLNEPYYVFQLQNYGWAYTKGEVFSGTNGLIIYSSGNGVYRAYDRNAPHICPDNHNTILEVKNNNKIVCKKDNSEWFLSNGAIISVASKPVKIYQTEFNPTTGSLFIFQ